MPGYVSWKQLYIEELLQMKEEGYDLSKAPVLDTDGEQLLPFPGCEAVKGDDEAVWEEAYHILEEILKGPLRADYPYYEPNGFEEILTEAEAMPVLEPVKGEVYGERIKGAVYGRIAAVVLGKPLEMGFNQKQVREYLEGANAWPLDDFVPAYSEGTGIEARKDCFPSTKGNINCAQPDDDINYTLLALVMAEKHGLDFTPEHVGYNWINNIPYYWCWCASRQAYYHTVTGLPVELIPTTQNPWRECIDGQIRTDLWGYIAPGDIRTAAWRAYKDCSFSLVKNGIYGGMFVAGCIAGALSENPTIEKILQSGLSVIPVKSRLAEAVKKVWLWYKETGDFDFVCGKIYETWDHLPFAATINNMAIVVLSLLHGKLDYEKTITSAVCAGMDTDCNAGTVGSIVGAAVGIDAIAPRWYTPLNDTIKSTVADIGQISISEVVKRIISIADQ
ncbi:MAG: ADP-ribosylglycohydrolase family protein [Ruminococcaceae bacterium]|nr:ADP-ribosylglycohydrolase family protein [Oscillospiraceae bacterium]